MTENQCIDRVQRALEFIEDHLEHDLDLDAIADVACYSPNHFIWVFRVSTGLTPMEYVRRRKMTEAAVAILAGEDIVDAAYRFGFSAQDTFTRSFAHTIGLPPGQLRKNRDWQAHYTPALNFEHRGGIILNHNLDCNSRASALRVQHLFSRDVKVLVGEITEKPKEVREIDPHILDELIEARIVRKEQKTAVIDTAVFFERDLPETRAVAEDWGADLAGRIADISEKLPAMSPDVRRLYVGFDGIDQGIVQILTSRGYAFDHRSTEGRYGGAKIDFHEVCDAYDWFGPYLLGGRGFHGRIFEAKIIGSDPGIYEFLNVGSEESLDSHVAFQSKTRSFLTDAFARMLSGDLDDRTLMQAAELSGLIRNGKPVATILSASEVQANLPAMHLVREILESFLEDRAKDMKAFLLNTTSGRQGVAPDKQMLELMRYVRMVTHRSLYELKFYTDKLLEDKNITVFRERLPS
jgi:AraC-like DNA-binding protein